MNSKLLLTVLVVVSLALAGGQLISQDEDPVPPARPSAAEMQAKMMEAMALAQPGEEHLDLEDDVGEWEDTMTFYMQPGSPPMKTNTKTSRVMILGGRFQENRTTGKFMGMPMEALYIMGFDRRSNEWTSVGFDTQGTYSVASRGKKDPQTGKIILYGEDMDPQLGKQAFRMEIENVSPDEIRTEVIFTEVAGQVFPGDGFKMVEIVSRRVVEDEEAGE